MMTLRPFTFDDAPIILSWIKDIAAFRKWSADRYPTFPPTPARPPWDFHRKGNEAKMKSNGRSCNDKSAHLRPLFCSFNA